MIKSPYQINFPKPDELSKQLADILNTPYKELDDLEVQIKELASSILSLNGNMEETVKIIRNRLESLATQLANIQLQKGDKGDAGKDYVLTPTDKEEIALLALMGIEIPTKVVEIQKTEVIREIPIVTENVVEVAKKDTSTETRDKLESLKGDERLDVSAIKGFEVGKMITQDLLDRAISILDQRTSFLINKLSNLQTQVNNIPTASSSSSFGLIALTSGAIDGTNSVYVWASAPNVLITDGGRVLTNGDGFTLVGTTTTLDVYPNRVLIAF